MKPIRKTVNRLLIKLGIRRAKREKDEGQLLALGALLSKQQRLMQGKDGKFTDTEFRIFSQNGEDGIIQWLVRNIHIENKVFIEFGVENYAESNTRFLMLNDNWSGFVMDGSEKNMRSLQERPWFWKYSLQCKAAFVTRENINGLLGETGFENIGILSVDIDGNDAHVLDALDLSRLNPSIIIVEYNALFGRERPVTVPYRADFLRVRAHYSCLFFGASLPALTHIAAKKGYELVGCDSSGSNAFFVRKDLLNDKVCRQTVDDAYMESKCRQSRGLDGKMDFMDGENRLAAIRGLAVLNVVTGGLEKL
jgi:hypothetical protein